MGPDVLEEGNGPEAPPVLPAMVLADRLMGEGWFLFGFPTDREISQVRRAGQKETD
jgi:hypothetical protein